MEALAKLFGSKHVEGRLNDLILILDSCEVIGQHAIVQQVGELVIETGQNRALLVVGGASFYDQITTSLGKECEVKHIPITACQDDSLEAIHDELQSLENSIKANAVNNLCVILQGLTDLVLLHPLFKVLEFVAALRKLPVLGIIGCIHTDVISRESVLAFERVAKASLQISSVFQDLQSLGFPQHTRIDGTIILLERKRTGRVGKKQQWYQLQGDNKLLWINELKDPQLQLPKVGNNPASQKSEEKLGMRHSLNAEEEMARGQVALPHTKIVQGNSERSSSQQIGTLGQIHYLRDSESEYDSDEDPDNDLDI